MISRCKFLPSVVLILFSSACIDRINFDIAIPSVYPVVIDGFISDQAGPYTIQVSKAFDIESKSSFRKNISVKQMIISDNYGTEEILSETLRIGFYQTHIIQGVVGRVYKIRIELLDGRVYESLPDTLLPSGTVDSIYFKFRTDITDIGTKKYGFDVLFNSTAGNRKNYYFMWRFKGTYKADIPCCSCYAFLENNLPIISDHQLVQSGRFTGVEAGYIPITGFTFMYKVHAQINQMSLSRNAFNFWKAVQSQANANGSLFQPITGKIPNNFIQIKGEEGSIQGLFYATSTSSNATFIYRSDIPNHNYIPIIQFSTGAATASCRDFFPGSSEDMPAYWHD